MPPTAGVQLVGDPLTGRIERRIESRTQRLVGMAGVLGAYLTLVPGSGVGSPNGDYDHHPRLVTIGGRLDGERAIENRGIAPSPVSRRRQRHS